MSGSVQDQADLPLVRVKIVEKGTSNGTTPDFDGNYIISLQNGATLAYSYPGYITAEEAVNNRTAINIMPTEGVELDEVQLVGSGVPSASQPIRWCLLME